MKKLIYASAFLASLSLISCGGGDSKNENGAATETTGSSDKPAPVVINEADWELKDISTIDKELAIPPFAVKLPKDAKIEKDTSSLTPGLLVTFKNKYELRIQYKEHFLAAQDLAKTIAANKATDLGTDTLERQTKILLEDANGYVFVVQSRDVTTGKNLGDPIVHFSYYIKDKTDSYINIEDSRWPISGVDNEGDLFSEANTKKIREIIASSAAFK